MDTAAHVCMCAGNPTNIIVAQAYSLSFIGYTKWMALPTVGAYFCTPKHAHVPPAACLRSSQHFAVSPCVSPVVSQLSLLHLLCSIAT
jgi:hypothetical protein